MNKFNVFLKKFSILIIFSLSGILVGFVIASGIIYYISYPSFKRVETPIANKILGKPNKNIIGFLPFWLTSRAQQNYSKYITTLTYFGLTLGPNGTIEKLVNPTEQEPGWTALNSGIMTPFFNNAKSNGLYLSLLVFSGDKNTIFNTLNKPVLNADNLVGNVAPIMKKYGFKDLNLDIENTGVASNDAQLKFTDFIKEVKKQINYQNLGTLTVEVSPDDLIKHNLINLKDIGSYPDYIVLMAYDYHYTGSAVTGPVAPLSGAGIVSEYDTQSAVKIALENIPSDKLILGIPLYGYEWESLGESTRSAVIPGTGEIASNERAENLFNSCSTCTLMLDKSAQEAYFIFKDPNKSYYNQVFFPNKKSTQAKVSFANKIGLGGIAVWALGYEGNTILDPLASYKND